MDDLVVVASVDGILEVRVNRPEKKNAWRRGMYEAVRAALEHADADPAIRVVLLTGTGDTFTSGNDVKDFQARAAINEATHASPFLKALSSLKKPLVAA